MARPGLEPGTPRFSASWSGLLHRRKVLQITLSGDPGWLALSLRFRGVPGGFWTWRGGDVLFGLSQAGEVATVGAGRGRARRY
jgi:hypothetical protein